MGSGRAIVHTHTQLDAAERSSRVRVLNKLTSPASKDRFTTFFTGPLLVAFKTVLPFQHSARTDECILPPAPANSSHPRIERSTFTNPVGLRRRNVVIPAIHSFFAEEFFKEFRLAVRSQKLRFCEFLNKELIERVKQQDKKRTHDDQDTTAKSRTRLSVRNTTRTLVYEYVYVVH